MNGVGRGKALLYALFALGVGVVSYVIGVQSGIGQLAEQSVLGASEFTFDPPAPLSLVSTWSVGAALLVILLVAWRYRGFGRALWIVLFGGAAILASQLLKQEWLIRPSLLDFEADNTFPSGHMTVFAVVVGGAIWALPAASRVWPACSVPCSSARPRGSCSHSAGTARATCSGDSPSVCWPSVSRPRSACRVVHAL
ncbi:phosphatase PAP2 family protein [Leucobacter soli]|uniref:hypothetical protein n=1 Tax=Leucobacter soli TaxID=2812850 RepID=UPI0036151A0D